MTPSSQKPRRCFDPIALAIVLASFAPWQTGCDSEPRRSIERQPKSRPTTRPGRDRTARVGPQTRNAAEDDESLLAELERIVSEQERSAKPDRPEAGVGKQGDWPGGHKDGQVRFIRLQYDGKDWDDGLTRGGADANFLAEFRKMASLDPKHVARKGEYHRISLLVKYPKGQAPPFVYMTGSRQINISAGERKVLREYLLDGGMLLADCGHQQWHHSFVRFMQQVFPDKRLIDIPKDDRLFSYPFVFPQGPPSLWHHGGSNCKGIRHKGRWIVFYHPGGLKDAWKTGHSGLRPKLAKQAYALGANILYYSFTQYTEHTRKQKKPRPASRPGGDRPGR